MPFGISGLSPRVDVFEQDFSSIVSPASTSIGAMVGSFRWGAVEQINSISSEPELRTRYGKPTNDDYLDFFVSAQFLAYQGSDHLKLIRVVGELAKNAASGGDGAGLTLDVTTLNGAVSSIVANAAGTGYIPGDVVFVNDANASTLAKVRVLTVIANGAVGTLDLLTNGAGYAGPGTVIGVATTIITNVLVKNQVDLDGQNNLPDIIAKYPGALGNSLKLSVVRASEFDNWTFNSRFITPPAATIVKFDADGVTGTFPITAALAADAVITNSGLTLANGSSPGQYEATSSVLTIHGDAETFVASGATNSYTLANVGVIPVAGFTVTVDGGAPLTVDTGTTGTVPFGQVRVIGNAVDIGINMSEFDGDGNTAVYTIVGVTGITDAIVKVDGVPFTVVAVPPATGEVEVVTAGSDTTVTFFAGEEPAVGNNNVVVTYGFVTSGDDVVVTYGFPVSGTDIVKVFTSQLDVHAIVSDAGGVWTDTVDFVLETYTSLSLTLGDKEFDGTDRYYVDAINDRSVYVAMTNTLIVFTDYLLTGGVDDAAGVSNNELQEGYSLFRDSESIDISHVMTSAHDSSTVLYAIQNVCDFRKDCVAYLSPQLADVVNNIGSEDTAIVAYRQNFPSSSYAHYDGNWKKVYDRYNDKFRWIPCNGDSAGLYAAVSENQFPWLSGAGLNRGRIKNVVELAWTPNQTKRDILYANQCNPITQFVNDGPVLFGDKTMQVKASAFDRMNVRWLFIVLEKSIATMARYFLFENNTQTTRRRFVNTINPFLRQVKALDGLEEFLVVANEDNNPLQVRQENKLVGDIMIRPVFSINYIDLRFSAIGGSVTFEEVVRGFSA